MDFQLERPDDERLNIYLVTDGESVQVAHVNHDEHGWDGMGLAEAMAMRIAQATGGRVEEADR